MYKILNWYTKRFKFPYKGWKFARLFLKTMGLLDRSFCKKLHNGRFIYVTPSEHIQQQLFWYGYYEKDIILTWEAFINDTTIVLDIGANTGYYSVIAAPGAKQVYAFEPATTIREQLMRNTQLNQFSNVSIEPYAASDETGVTELYISWKDNSGMSGLQPADNFSGVIESINAISVDEWATKKLIDSVHLIKIDVEGSEINVLTGMKKTLQKYRPVVFIEIHDELLKKRGNSSTSIYTLFEELGYQPLKIVSAKKLQRAYGVGEANAIVFIPQELKLPRGISLS